MVVKGKTLFTKILIWLVSEIVLNMTALDTLADYSEFVFAQNTLSYLASEQSLNPNHNK